MMPTLEELRAKNVAKIRKAAVAFANDYGPLAAANAGDEQAAHEVARKMVHALRKQGARITFEK